MEEHIIFGPKPSAWVDVAQGEGSKAIVLKACVILVTYYDKNNILRWPFPMLVFIQYAFFLLDMTCCFSN